MSKFTDQLDAAYKKKVVENAEKVTRKTAIFAFGQIVENTPVDTGRARGNWHIETGFLNQSVLDAVDLTDPTSKATSNTASYKIDETIYISNNLPYIRRLNDGYSTQAPASFVESAVQVGIARGKE